MEPASKIVQWSRRGGYLRKRVAQVLLVFLFSLDIPPDVEVEEGVRFLHNGLGTVVHPKTVLKEGSVVCQGVTIGVANPWGGSAFLGIEIGPRAWICAGAKVLCGEDTLIVGPMARVGANAVLTHSIGGGEVWAGVPARKIGDVSHETIVE